MRWYSWTASSRRANSEIGVGQTVFIEIHPGAGRQVAQRRLEMCDGLVGLLFVQRQDAQIILVAPAFVARPAPRDRARPGSTSGTFLSTLPLWPSRRVPSPAAAHSRPLLSHSESRSRLLVPPGLNSLPPVHLRDAAISDRARRIRSGHLNVALILANGFAVAALLEVDVTEVNNGRLKFRIERQGASYTRRRHSRTFRTAEKTCPGYRAHWARLAQAARSAGAPR